jgi:hypothetical protein
MATISYRRNVISQIMNEHGAWVQDHESKAGLLWIAFRNRMGSTSHPTMIFVLNSMIATIDGLDDLASPISHDEIDGGGQAYAK